MTFHHVIRTGEQLRENDRPPARPALAKQLDHLDHHRQAPVAISRLVGIASSDGAGRCDG